MNQKNNKNSRLITIYHQNIWVKPVTGLAYLPGNYSSMKEKEKSAALAHNIIKVGQRTKTTIRVKIRQQPRMKKASMIAALRISC